MLITNINFFFFFFWEILIAKFLWDSVQYLTFVSINYNVLL